MRSICVAARACFLHHFEQRVERRVQAAAARIGFHAGARDAKFGAEARERRRGRCGFARVTWKRNLPTALRAPGAGRSCLPARAMQRTVRSRTLCPDGNAWSSRRRRETPRCRRCRCRRCPTHRRIARCRASRLSPPPPPRRSRRKCRSNASRGRCAAGNRRRLPVLAQRHRSPQLSPSALPCRSYCCGRPARRPRGLLLRPSDRNRRNRRARAHAMQCRSPMQPAARAACVLRAHSTLEPAAPPSAVCAARNTIAGTSVLAPAMPAARVSSRKRFASRTVSGGRSSNRAALQYCARLSVRVGAADVLLHARPTSLRVPLPSRPSPTSRFPL